MTDTATPTATTQIKLAFITGVNGQDGSYLVELLLNKGYERIYGLIRRASTFNLERLETPQIRLRTSTTIQHQPSSPLVLLNGDLTDSGSLDRVFKTIVNDYPVLLAGDAHACRLEVYNLAAQSHVGVSFETPVYTGEVDALGVARLLDCIRQNGLIPVTRFYQASTSELFGLVQETPQKETTPFYPRSPYAVAKMYGYWIVKNYREAYGMYACTGILFNHESPRRGAEFVTRKITMGIANILAGRQECIQLGNIYAKRDWFHAKDAVVAMWLMLQHDEPLDFVISSNETHSVKEFIDVCMEHIGVKLHWEGSGLDEVGVDEEGKVWFRIDACFFRPSEVDLLHGCSDLARTTLGWKPSYDFKGLVVEMLESDIKKYGNGVSTS